MPGLPESNAKSDSHELNSVAIVLFPLADSSSLLWAMAWKMLILSRSMVELPGQSDFNAPLALHYTLGTAKSLQSGSASLLKHAIKVFGDQEPSVALRNTKNFSKSIQNRLPETAQTPGLSPNRLAALDPAEKWGNLVPWQVLPQPTPLEPNFW